MSLRKSKTRQISNLVKGNVIFFIYIPLHHFWRPLYWGHTALHPQCQSWAANLCKAPAKTDDDTSTQITNANTMNTSAYDMLRDVLGHSHLDAVTALNVNICHSKVLHLQFLDRQAWEIEGRRSLPQGVFSLHFFLLFFFHQQAFCLFQQFALRVSRGKGERGVR